ncbi:MAG TPA: DUF1998 domain-containing protein [Anaerolineae bacterium]|nr:DUF1998 domain-containing protein [Anaerolineae bacterium]
MSKGPIRRSHLVAPFGVGAMTVVRDGTSVIAAGLDHWYRREDGSSDGLDDSEFRFNEWRLEGLLGVSHLRLPPDFRKKQHWISVPNCWLTVPYLRFPQWHFCPDCRTLTELPLNAPSAERCADCRLDLVQVSFVAMCEAGHLQDFPWREWVHRSGTPQCSGRLRLLATGGTSLASQLVTCDCGIEPRSLQDITSANTDGTTHLSHNLRADGIEFLCRGGRPWLGSGSSVSCSKHLRGTLRNAANVYFSVTHSALYIPRSSGRTLSTESGDDELRLDEYALLRQQHNTDELLVEPVRVDAYRPPVVPWFSGVSLVKRLRETRAFGGFRRVNPDNNQTVAELKSVLRKTPLTPAEDWLPAVIVRGEGIFLELDAHALAQWEQREDVIRRVSVLVSNYARAGREAKGVTPRMVLLHTLAHLLINRMAYECGYGSASLRERLYVSSESGSPMAGVLIYTAAGDSEGTLGGLVRAGQPGSLEAILARSIGGASWCSADPICMELGRRAGQGPLSCNLAACHSCAHVPETACEQFNRFLDRGVVVGDPLSDTVRGFFQDAV